MNPEPVPGAPGHILVLVKQGEPLEKPRLVRELDWAGRVIPHLTLAENAYELVQDCDAIIVCTEWNEFKHLDLARVKGMMKQPVIIDGRNIYEPAVVTELGFVYRAVGRGYDSEEDE